ncbi:MAG: lauroyl acyltransferase [Silanimonas sp.]
MRFPPSAHALRALAWLAGLPGARLRAAIAERLADRECQHRGGRARVIDCNLRLVALDPRLTRSILVQTYITLLESLRFWTRRRATNLRAVAEVDGLQHLEAGERAGPVVIVAPHYGNWELLVQWVATRRPLTLIYTRGKSAAFDGFLRLVRERNGVCAVPADLHGLKPLLRALQRGETVGITPDQTPDAAGGLWSPFFGVPALTMTLLHRLGVRHPEARFVMAVAERMPKGRFRVIIQPLPAAVTSGPVRVGLDALNSAVEAMARRDPTQYQWTYKRFKGQRADEAPVNPYWPECY